MGSVRWMVTEGRIISGPKAGGRVRSAVEGAEPQVPDGVRGERRVQPRPVRRRERATARQGRGVGNGGP